MKLSRVVLHPALRWARANTVKFQLLASHKQLIAERAWAMRQAPTPSEATLWQAICKKQLGVTFKRQQPVGKYIADFVAPAAKLIVEVDGGYHTSRAAADARRDRYLTRAGYRVVHIPAEVVVRQLSVAVEQIRAALGQLA